jgi:hypothetical protein
MTASMAPIETIRIGMVAGGDPERLASIQEHMRKEERGGRYRILRMDHNEAVIQWLDLRVMMVLGGEAECHDRPQ